MTPSPCGRYLVCVFPLPLVMERIERDWTDDQMGRARALRPDPGALVMYYAAPVVLSGLYRDQWLSLPFGAVCKPGTRFERCHITMGPTASVWLTGDYRFDNNVTVITRDCHERVVPEAVVEPCLTCKEDLFRRVVKQLESPRTIEEIEADERRGNDETS